ncbi:hypothetical protein SLEP1_g38556 [Rubroshorea leprosula]|nr:hypothetical protein SLEP1_g38556 [Rubroshorea leprosula]
MRGDMGDMQKPFINQVSHEMKINGNVLHARVHDGIQAQVGSTHIITENGRGSRRRNTQFGEQVTDPDHFRSSSCERPVLSLGRTSSNCFLFGSAPGNGIGTQKNQIASGADK